MGCLLGDKEVGGGVGGDDGVVVGGAVVGSESFWANASLLGLVGEGDGPLLGEAVGGCVGGVVV